MLMSPETWQYASEEQWEDKQDLDSIGKDETEICDAQHDCDLPVGGGAINAAVETTLK